MALQANLEGRRHRRLLEGCHWDKIQPFGPYGQINPGLYLDIGFLHNPVGKKKGTKYSCSGARVTMSNAAPASGGTRHGRVRDRVLLGNGPVRGLELRFLTSDLWCLWRIGLAQATLSKLKTLLSKLISKLRGYAD